MSATLPLADHLAADWKHRPRWQGVKRPYSAAEVLRLRGTVHVEHSLARLGADKFWSLLHSEPLIGALGCMSGHPAIQAGQAGPDDPPSPRAAGRERHPPPPPASAPPHHPA